LKHVAAEIGVADATLSAWETGKRFPSGKHLELIARCTRLPLCVFFIPDSVACPCLTCTARRS